jgi:acetylornithine deacetylase/succinyl-diaminopimelate desuccinylase-like protein
MGMENYTRYQQGIIKRYYEHADGIALQRLSELVGELYLAEGKKKAKAWEAVAAAMQKLGVPQTRIDHVVAQGKPELVAGVVKELQGKS